MLKTLFSTLLKLAVAVIIIGWLISSGKLDWSQLKLFQQDMWLVAASLFYFVFAVIFLGTWRWKTLLQGAGYIISWKRALTLQTTGLFFSSVMPGAVGGDVAKIAYVIRDNPTKSKALAMMTALLDRIVGLAGLFLICWIMIVFNYQTVQSTNGFWPILLIISGLSFGFILFFCAALYHYRGNDPFLSLFKLRLPGVKFIEKLYQAMRVYRYARGSIFLSLGISLLIQGLCLLLFYFITGKVSGGFPPFGKIAIVFPIGVTATAIPLAPAGLGVGHVAFDQLFHMVGLEHGANAFNLFALSQLVLNLTGVIPYLSLKKIPLPELTGETDSSSEAKA
ncbi:MAG: flippase-like domain-containing protein [Chitinophagaceae bacterium]|nr:flippase-like domain-containing protein [Oligoflexus sp.]